MDFLKHNMIYLLIASTLFAPFPVVDESRCPNYRVFFNSFKVFSNYPNSLMRNILLNQMKSRCYEDIKSGLWGPQCKLSMRAKENCVLRCLCPQCYELVYESDPLEEGESNYARSLEYELCLYKLSAGETLEGVRGAFDC